MVIFGKKSKDRKGFTLVELMVVVAVIGILAAIAIPRFTTANAIARGGKIAADLRTIDSAIIMVQAQTGTVPANGLVENNANVMANLTTTNLTPATGQIIVNNHSYRIPDNAQYRIVNGRAAIAVGAGNITAGTVAPGAATNPGNVDNLINND